MGKYLAQLKHRARRLSSVTAIAAGEYLNLALVTEDVGLRLESAETVGGPYAPEASAVVDVNVPIITVPRPSDTRFSRGIGQAVCFTDTSRVGDVLVLHYEKTGGSML